MPHAGQVITLSLPPSPMQRMCHAQFWVANTPILSPASEQGICGEKTQFHFESRTPHTVMDESGDKGLARAY